MTRVPLVLLAPAVLMFAQDTLQLRANHRSPPLIVGSVIHSAYASQTAHAPVLTDAPLQAVIEREYNVPVVTAYWKETEPTEGNFTFSSPDEIVDWAISHGFTRMKGHVMVFHEETPAWVAAKPTQAAVQAAMVNHVTNVIGHFESKYPGVIQYWDICNELLRKSTPSPGTIWLATSNMFTDSPGLPTTGDLTTLIPVGIEAAYIAAHAACPACKLGYNDYHWEFSDPVTGVASNMLNLVRFFQRDGVPLDYLGMQMHINWNQTYTPATVNGHAIISQLNNVLNAIGALGITAQISEMDIVVPTIPSQNDLDLQTAMWGLVMRTCFYNHFCSAFITWGVEDTTSWLGPSGRPLLFDVNLQPKAGYFSVLNAMDPAPLPEPPPTPVVTVGGPTQSAGSITIN